MKSQHLLAKSGFFTTARLKNDGSRVFSSQDILHQNVRQLTENFEDFRVALTWDAHAKRNRSEDVRGRVRLCFE